MRGVDFFRLEMRAKCDDGFFPALLNSVLSTDGGGRLIKMTHLFEK